MCCMTRNPVVCGVTSLGMDHVSTLGGTAESIAWQKAGIFKVDSFIFFRVSGSLIQVCPGQLCTSKGSVLPCLALPCLALFCSVPFHSILAHFVLLCSHPLILLHVCPILSHSVLFHCTSFHSFPFCSFQQGVGAFTVPQEENALEVVANRAIELKVLSC